MARNKIILNKFFICAAAILMAILFVAAPADAKRKKKQKKEVIETPVLVDEIEAATEEIGFDPDSLYFVEPSADAVRQEALATILPNYNQWQTALLNGRLQMSGLPLSPSIKIFMDKGKSVAISVRIALLGEVGRIQITGDEILAINKMKRTYFQESIASIKYEYPDIISDLQSLLLGRVVVFRTGELTEEIADFMDFSIGEPYNNDKAWLLDYPKARTDADELGYQYVINTDGLISAMNARLNTSDKVMDLNITYENSVGGRDMSITYSKDGRVKFNTDVIFDNVQWDAAPFEPISITSRYTRLGINDFIKSFKL